MDLIDQDARQRLANLEPEAFLVSARQGQGLEALRRRVEELLPAPAVHVQAILPYTSGSLLEQVRQLGRVDSLEYRADGVALSADVDDRLAAAVLDQAIDQKPLQALAGDTPSTGLNS